MNGLADGCLHAALIAVGAYNNPSRLRRPQILSPKPVRHINHHDRCGVQFHRANVADHPNDLILFLAAPEGKAGAPNRVLAWPEALRGALDRKSTRLNSSH